MRENFLLVALFEVLDQVGGIIGVEFGGGPRQKFVRQGFRQLVAHRLVKFRQHLVIERRTERLNKRDAFIGLEQGDEIGEVGRLEISNEAGRQIMIGGGQGLRDGVHGFGRGPLAAVKTGFFFALFNQEVCSLADGLPFLPSRRAQPARL